MITINKHVLKPTIFPDRTSQVWHLPKRTIRKRNRIVWVFENDAEIFHLCQLKDLLDASGSEFCDVRVDYLPYARQDKSITNNSCFALHTFSRILNSCQFDDVYFFDGHSEKSTELVDNAWNSLPEKFLVGPVNKVRADTIAYPDKGAADRYDKSYDELLVSKKPGTVFGHKKRDPRTGHVKYTRLTGEVAGTTLIVDDICDGGMTFVLFAEMLYRNGASEVHLYVTHGIFSRGLKPLQDARIKRIFTKDGEVTRRW